MNKARITVLLITMIISSLAIIHSQSLEKKYDQKLNYLLYKPEGYDKDTSKSWPMIVFLHGGGERGNNLNKVKSTGPIGFTISGKKLPFIILSPQIRSKQLWDPEAVNSIVNEITRLCRVDTNRVYLTGLSIGGNGTWETSTRYPEKFAAIAPVSGWGDPKQLWKISRMPVWIFHGARDPVIPVIASQVMADTLKKYGNVKLTIYPNGMHGNWAETYNNEELYNWFLKYRKNGQVLEKR